MEMFRVNFKDTCDKLPLCGLLSSRDDVAATTMGAQVIIAAESVEAARWACGVVLAAYEGAEFVTRGGEVYEAKDVAGEAAVEKLYNIVEVAFFKDSAFKHVVLVDVENNLPAARDRKAQLRAANSDNNTYYLIVEKLNIFKS